MIDQLILAAEAVVRYRVATYRDRFKLTELQYRLLLHVEQHAPMSIGELAGMVARDVGQVSRTVRTLIDAELMVCTRTNGRIAKSLTLSAKGRDLFQQMATVGERWENAISVALPSEDIVQAAQAMQRLYVATHRVLENDTDSRAATVAFCRRDRRRADALRQVRMACEG